MGILAAAIDLEAMTPTRVPTAPYENYAIDGKKRSRPLSNGCAN
jgi:hypothetical protein